MPKQFILPFLFILIFCFGFWNCKDYAETPSAYQYDVHLDIEGESPKIGDQVIFHEKTFLNGKEMFSTYDFGAKKIILPPASKLTKPLPPNYEVLFTMSPGDSVTVWQPLIGMKNFFLCDKIRISNSSISSFSRKKKVGLTESGYLFNFFVDTPSPKAQIGDRVRYFEWRYKNDSLIYRTSTGKWTETFLPPRENLPAKPPGNYEALTMMGEGDSILLSQPMNDVEELPDYLSSDDTLNYVIKMLEVSTPGEVMAVSKLELALKTYAKDDAIKRASQIFEETKINIEKFNRGIFGKELLERHTGLKYVIHEKGNGQRPVMRQEVTVHYAGFLMDGTLFDNSFESGEPIVFPIGMKKVIAGWDEGIAMLKVGDKARFVIPSHLGYGSAGAGGVIPPDATLIFDVELVGVS